MLEHREAPGGLYYFRGRSVAKAAQILGAGQISEADAVVSYLKALVDLFRLEGSLLERRGVWVAGTQQ